MSNIGLIVQSILALTIVIDSLLLVFIFSKSKITLLYTLLLVHLLSILGWTISVLLLLRFESELATKWAFATATVMAASKFYFIKVFPDNTLPKNIHTFWPLIPAIIVFILSFGNNTIFNSVEIIDNYYVLVDNGPYASLHSLVIATYLLYPIYVLYKKYKSQAYSQIIHAQIKFLLWGFSLFFLIGLTTNSILPVFFDIYFFNGTGPTFSLILAAFVILTIAKHQFMDIKVIVQRGLIYTFLFALITLIYIALLQFFQYFINNTYEIGIVTAIVTTLFGIFTIPKLDIYLQNKTDRFFFKGNYNYADALYNLSGTISKKLVLRDIIQQTEQSLQELFKAKYVFVIVYPTKKYSPQDYKKTEKYTDPNIPIKLDTRIIGNISLGTKLSGDMYTPRDIELLKTFSNQMAVALEKARLYKEVEDYSRELEARVAERTTKIEELQENQKQLLIDISHNLQNPLTIVKGRLGLIEEDLLSREELTTFEQSIDDISSFIYDLLHLSRLEAQQHNIQKETFSISQLLEEHIEYYNVITHDMNIQLSSTIEENITVNGNQEKIKDLLSNLMSNAIKYIAKDSHQKEIRMSLTHTENTVILSIQDTGIGIHNEELPHIFKRFYRTKNRGGRKIAGTGLGLAICKKITDIHNGTIEAKSFYGAGTEFIVTLPK